jgi:hypothetical protein
VGWGGSLADLRGRGLVVQQAGGDPPVLSVYPDVEMASGVGIQCAKVSAIPGALPQPSMSPASQQGP